MAKFGRAAITWTSTEDSNTQRVFLLDVPLLDVAPAHSITTYYAESLDRTKNQTVTVGNGSYELQGQVRYASNPAGLIDVIKAGSQGKTLTYIPDTADPAVHESVILIGPRSPTELQVDSDRGFRGEMQVTLRFRRTDQKASPGRPRGGDVLFEYHAGDSLSNATYSRTTGGTYPSVSSTSDFGYGTLTTAAANKARVGWYSSVSSNGPRTFPALLLEPARTNLVKYAIAFNQWAKQFSTAIYLTSGQADPAGGTAAWEIRSSASVAGGGILSTTFTPSTFVAVSVFLKQSVATTKTGVVNVVRSTGVGNAVSLRYRFSSGTMVSSGADAGALVGVERYRNGWYRINGRSTVAVAQNCYMQINPPIAGAVGTTFAVYAFGAQVES